MISEIIQKNRALAISGLLFLLLFLGLTVTSIFDSTQILGVDRWIKPMKFAISICIFLWTLAVYVNFINGRDRAVKVISYGAIAMMVGEIVLIIMQAARGTTSHFNVATTFDALVFNAMGTMIVANTLLIIYLLYLYFRADIDLPQSIKWGMRLGMILFLFSSAEGGLMAGLLRHSIGTLDGGPGMPLVNWSSIAGDLRVAHFVGMHAFQAVPLFALAMEKLRIKESTALTGVFGGVYFAVFTFVLVEALLGKPLITMQ